DRREYSGLGRLRDRRTPKIVLYVTTDHSSAASCLVIGQLSAVCIIDPEMSRLLPSQPRDRSRRSVLAITAPATVIDGWSHAQTRNRSGGRAARRGDDDRPGRRRLDHEGGGGEHLPGHCSTLV